MRMEIGEFDAVFLKHFESLKHAVRKINSDDVEDIVHELYCHLVVTEERVNIVRHARPQALLKCIAKQKTYDWHRKYKRDMSLEAATSQQIETILSKWQYPTEDESAVGQETYLDAQGKPHRGKKYVKRNAPTWGKNVVM